jgi:hypothetical protein
MEEGERDDGIVESYYYLVSREKEVRSTTGLNSINKNKQRPNNSV